MSEIAQNRPIDAFIKLTASLDELQRQKAENARRLEELEREYLEKKKAEDEAQQEQSRYGKGRKKKKETSLAELNQILQREDELFHFKDRINQNKKQFKASRLLSAKDPQNKASQGKKLNPNEEKFIKSFAKYTANKMVKEDNQNTSHQHNEWNATRIHSKNVNGVVNRNDDLPGYLGKDDYGFYYHNIMSTQKQDLGKFKPPHWEVAKKRHDQQKHNTKHVGNDIQQCKKGEQHQYRKNEMFTISESQEIKK